MGKRKSKNKLSKDLLSLVIPAYRQEKTIQEDLKEIDRTLKNGLPSHLTYEIICVVDGFLDKTFEKASKVKSSKIKVIGYEENKGKGYAVRYGMKAAKGNLVSFLDAGRDISPKGVMMLVSHMDWYGADIIVGSKRHPVSMVNYPLLRKVLSVGYHLGVKVLFDLPLTDTQSGIKIFKREVVDEILPRLLVKRYAMDIEMLALARYLGFKRIYEAPIEVHFEKSVSRIKWFGKNSLFRMFWDTLAVFYRLKILHYYDSKNKKNWISD